MYNSRKVNTKVRFAKGQLNGGLAGLSLAPDGKGAAPSPLPAPAPMLPPSPAPPSPLHNHGEESDTEEVDDEYTRHAKQQTKAKLESITGRMFQVLNEFEDDQEDEEPGDDEMPSIELRNNIQSMITGYKDSCLEREELLTSLADWFEDDHIENLLGDIQNRRTSIGATPDGIKQSLLEGKQTSQRLKTLNEKILAAENHGLDTEHLKQQKDELEKELMTKINLVDEIEGPGEQPPTKTIDTAVTDSWKFAAVEICNMLHQVRESGSDELQELDGKIQELVYSMNQQTQVIEQLNGELQQQQQLAVFSDQTTLKLSADNSLLHEEVDVLRDQLVEAKHTIASLQADLHRMEIKAEFESKRATAANQKKAASAKGKRPKSTTTTTDDVAKYELQVSDLCLEIATLTQVNDDLKLTVENIEKEFEDARLIFEAEITNYQAELERLECMGPTSQQPGGEKQNSSTTSTLSQLPTIPEQNTEQQTASLSQRRISQQEGIKSIAALGDRRKSSMVGREVQLLQIKLLDRETQLKKSQDSIDKLQEKLIALERELQSMRKENDGLMKLQEKSAALIGQASTCLQIKSEQKSHKEVDTIASDESYSQQRPRIVETMSTTVTHNTEKKECYLDVNTASTATRLSVSTTEIGETVNETVDKNPPPNFWSAMGSLDVGENKFGMPQERTHEEKKAESLQMVLKLIEHVNENQTDFASSDSKALTKVQTELQKICQLVTGFLEYSSNLVNDEADVVSNAMDSLMSHLPEEEKPKLPGHTPSTNKQSLAVDRRTQARLSIAEVKYEEREKFKERVAHFADQAIDVIKAGERALSRKIHTQHKNLQTVVHAMEDHKRRQSQAFKFTPPDSKTLSKGLMLEAHAVSTHDISTKQSHHEQKQPSEKRRALIERLRKFTRPQGNPSVYYANTDPDTRAFPSFRGLGSTLFTGNTLQQGQCNTLANTKIPEPGFGRLSVQNVTDQGRRNKTPSFLQVDATHTQSNQHNTDLIHRNVRQLHNQYQEAPTQIWGKSGSSLTIGRNRKPKLHKPFHFPQPSSVDPSTGMYSTVTKTAPAGATRKYGRGTNKNQSTRNGKRDGKIQENAVCKQDPLSTGSQALPNCNPPATFFDLVSHSNTIGKGGSDDPTVKLPPLANL